MRGFLADRPQAVAALTRIFLAEIERALLTACGVTHDADMPNAARPRLGGISFLHRFGSALNRHVHLHACVTDGVFAPSVSGTAPVFVPAQPITRFHLATLTERVRRRMIRLFRLKGLLDAAAAADMLAWENSGFSIDASVRITLLDRDANGRIARIRYVLPRRWVILWAANWVGPGRKRKSTQPGASGVIELAPFEFLDRLADLIPQPRKHRHRYHGVFAPNHKLRKAVTALAIRNIGTQQEAANSAHGRHDAEDSCSTGAKPRSHDTSRIAWAKLMARIGEEFPLECPGCGGDIRLRGDGRQEPAHFEPEVRKREKARMASPA